MKRLFLSAVACLWGCQRAGGAETAAAPSMPPSKVEVVTLSLGPVEDTSDYVAVLASRQAVTLYPLVSGYVRALPKMPGASVKRGEVLVQIDATAEQATLTNLAASREAQASALALAKERLTRAQALRTDGIVSQQSADEAKAAVEQADASLRATDALIASQRARVGYYQVAAPLDGVVGNVPVKLGDFVTPQVALTSVTQQSALEAEVYVPVERAPLLGPDSRLRLVGSDGAVLGEQPITFVAPRVDPATQLVLIKAVFGDLANVRADQTVRATVVWRRHEGLVIPSAAVLRQAGQPFVFVVEKKDSLSVARRVPLTLGTLKDGVVEVTEGLNAGQTLVVSGIQMLGDGSAVEPKAPPPG